MHVEIVLVRHGQSEGNRDRRFTGHGPSRLTELGRAQAEATGRALFAEAAAGGAPIDAIYSSDLIRCVETAAPLVRLTGLAPVESRRIRERDMGDFTGRTFEEVQAEWPEGWQAMISRTVDYRPPGGESHGDTRDRVGAWLDEVLGERQQGKVIVFSHGVAINHMLRHLLGLDRVHIGRTVFTVDNCSLQRLEQHPGHRTVRVIALNETAHLAALPPGAG